MNGGMTLTRRSASGNGSGRSHSVDDGEDDEIDADGHGEGERGEGEVGAVLPHELRQARDAGERGLHHRPPALVAERIQRL